MDQRGQNDRERVLVLRSADRRQLYFSDGNEAAPDITYAIEVWRTLPENASEFATARLEGSGRLTIPDRDLRSYNERRYILQIEDGRRVPILVDWEEVGITHPFVTVGEPTTSEGH